jgi:hypothetical protein
LRWRLNVSDGSCCWDWRGSMSWAWLLPSFSSSFFAAWTRESLSCSVCRRSSRRYSRASRPTPVPGVGVFGGAGGRCNYRTPAVAFPQTRWNGPRGGSDHGSDAGLVRYRLHRAPDRDMPCSRFPSKPCGASARRAGEILPLHVLVRAIHRVTHVDWHAGCPGSDGSLAPGLVGLTDSFARPV